MKMAKFDKSIGLPVTLTDEDFDEEPFGSLTEAATKTNEWKNAPFPIHKRRVYYRY